MESIFQTITLLPDGIGRIIVPEAPSWRRVLLGLVVGGPTSISAAFSENASTDAIPAVGNSTFLLSPGQMLYATVIVGSGPASISIHVSHVVGDEMKHPHVEYDGDRIP